MSSEETEGSEVGERERAEELSGADWDWRTDSVVGEILSRLLCKRGFRGPTTGLISGAEGDSGRILAGEALRNFAARKLA